MIVLPSSRPRWTASILIAVLGTLLGWFVLFSRIPICEGIKQASYDTLHRLHGEFILTNSEVVLVYLDLQSYIDEKQDPSRPWPRELHARLVDRLTAAGARAVVFDIVFSGAGPGVGADTQFAQAIGNNGHVILAAEYSDQSSQWTGNAQSAGRLRKLSLPTEAFLKAAAGWGIGEQRIDDDFTVRSYLAGFTGSRLPSLTWAAAEQLKLPVTDRADDMRAANQRWVKYYGRPLTIPHCSFSRALSATDVPDAFFRNKIVFIGGRTLVGVSRQRQDEFRSPFSGWQSSDLFMPGAEVNAVELENLIRQDWLSLSRFETWFILCAGFAGGLLVWFRPAHGTVLALASCLITTVGALFAFQCGVWFPWLIVAGLQTPCALAGSVLFYAGEWWRARQRYEDAKRVAEAKIREQAALIEKARDAILLLDLNGKVLYANPAVERVYGWSMTELQASEVMSQLFAPDAPAAAKARDTALSQGEWIGELTQRTKSGRTVIVASRWTLINTEREQTKALLQINTDITETKQLEAQFLRTQRMNTIGSLAGGMAHDLNNALAPILMGVQLLRRQDGDAETRRLLGMMETNTHRSAEMVRQVLLFARGRSGDFQRLDLALLLGELERIVRETFPKNISLESFIPRDLWQIEGNSTQIHQVLLNLCVNARDAMPNGGKLAFVADNVDIDASLSAEPSMHEDPRATEDNPPAGRYVSLSVSDTGTGMPPEVKARIFEAFFTTKPEGQGTGIGLSTVLRIVKSHKGFVRVESEPGQGTTFEVLFPKAAELAAETRPDQPAEPARAHGEIVLVADDEKAIRELVADSLRAQGYTVITAANGQEALAAFRENSAKVRVLFTDSSMPVMDGRAAIHEIRRLQPDLPVILASGEEQTVNGELQENIILLEKPFSLSDMLAAVARATQAAMTDDLD